MKPPISAPQTRINRRHWIGLTSWSLLLTHTPHVLATEVVAVRLWPSPLYTRLTIESDRTIGTRHHYSDFPPRLVVELDEMVLSPILADVGLKIQPDDPNVAAIRVTQVLATVVKIQIDLKQSAAPQVFALNPIANYAHRLVIDLYGERTSDPLGALIHQQSNKKATPPASAAALSQPDSAQQPRPDASKPSRDPLNNSVAPLEDKGQSRMGLGENTKGKTQPHRKMGTTEPKLFVVVIDPGHGGEDPGAIGPSGTKEKDVVLSVARKLQEKLTQTTLSGVVIKAQLTRDGDYFVPLNRRVEKAQALKADLLLSIHADAFNVSTARGASVFALSQRGASSSAAKWMADKENSADLVGGINLKAKDASIQRVMLDMSTSAQIRDSLRVGDVLLRRIGRIGTLHKRTVEQAGFAVLKAPDIPSVLIETAFISNPDEEALLRSPGYQHEIADALAQGVVAYLQRTVTTVKPRRT